MARYLLGTQALIDSAGNKDNSIHRWAAEGGFGVDQVVVSVVSFHQFRAILDGLDRSDPNRAIWEAHFARARERFEAYGLICQVSLEIALEEVKLRPLKLQARHPKTDELYELSSRSLLVLATALVEGLILVDRAQPCHEVLAPWGLKIHDPYAT